MLRLFPTLLLLLLLSSTTVLSLPLEVSIHDNYIHFNSPSPSTTINIVFEMKDYSITAGQPFQGVENSGGGTLDVKAGRHASSAPAALFMSGLQAINVFSSKHIAALAPSELNFAIVGKLTITFNSTTTTTTMGEGENGVETLVFDDFHIGQGHYSTANNWWVGAKTCVTAPESHLMTCATSIFGKKVQIRGQDSTSDSFLITRD